MRNEKEVDPMGEDIVHKTEENKPKKKKRKEEKKDSKSEGIPG